MFVQLIERAYCISMCNQLVDLSRLTDIYCGSMCTQPKVEFLTVRAIERYCCASVCTHPEVDLLTVDVTSLIS